MAKHWTIWTILLIFCLGWALAGCNLNKAKNSPQAQAPQPGEPVPYETDNFTPGPDGKRIYFATLRDLEIYQSRHARY